MPIAQTGASRRSGVGHESIDGTLSGPLLQFDLAAELDQLHRDESWQHPTGRSSKTLVKYPDLRIVLIAMKANTRMHEQRRLAESRCTRLTATSGSIYPSGWWISLPGTCWRWISVCPMMWRQPRIAPFC